MNVSLTRASLWTRTVNTHVLNTQDLFLLHKAKQKHKRVFTQQVTHSYTPTPFTPTEYTHTHSGFVEQQQLLFEITFMFLYFVLSNAVCVFERETHLLPGLCSEFHVRTFYYSSFTEKSV